jgi:hypothetical protein
MARVSPAAVPSTHPERKGRAVAFRLSESRMKIVAVIGTVLSAAAAATAIS